jgi:ATP-binding cassette subfamily B protein
MALEAAQLDEFVSELPYGLHTPIGENGLQLSGGQRQRLALARSFYRRSQFLLLDEATSALDNATQSSVLDALERRKLTLISVAHRLDAALRSDQVLVMRNGAVIEQGSPQQLLAAEGAFHALVQAESSNQGVSA